jgi:hypothetical protein
MLGWQIGHALACSPIPFFQKKGLGEPQRNITKGKIAASGIEEFNSPSQLFF